MCVDSARAVPLESRQVQSAGRAIWSPVGSDVRADSECSGFVAWCRNATPFDHLSPIRNSPGRYATGSIRGHRNRLPSQCRVLSLTLGRDSSKSAPVYLHAMAVCRAARPRHSRYERLVLRRRGADPHGNRGGHRLPRTDHRGAGEVQTPPTSSSANPGPDGNRPSHAHRRNLARSASRHELRCVRCDGMGSLHHPHRADFSALRRGIGPDAGHDIRNSRAAATAFLHRPRHPFGSVGTAARRSRSPPVHHGSFSSGVRRATPNARAHLRNFGQCGASRSCAHRFGRSPPVAGRDGLGGDRSDRVRRSRHCYRSSGRNFSRGRSDRPQPRPDRRRLPATALRTRAVRDRPSCHLRERG